MNSSMMSVFDPSSTILFMLPVKWMVLVSTYVLWMYTLWSAPSGVSLLSEYLFKMTKSMKMGSILLYFGMFILSANLMGLFPWVFTVTSHLMYVLSLSLPLWAGGMIYSFKKSSTKTLAHLCPEGLEGFSALFIIMIEIVSLLIRPFSLAIRLMANLTAGHLILSLCESMVSSQELLVSPFGMLMMCVILLFESAVAIIQSYIFISLLMLYWDENIHY